MRKASSLVIFGTLLAAFAGSAQALGFGRIGGSTTLGQPLNFSAVVRIDGEETLGNECVSADVMSGENKLPASAVRTSIDNAANPNERLVRVTTTTLLDEPVVTVNLTVGCAPRLSRKFVVFLDPPFVNLAQTPASEPAPADPSRVAAVPAAPASAPAAAPSGSAAASAPVNVARAAPPRPRPRPKVVTINPNAAPAPAPRPRKPNPDTEIAKTAPSGPRLKLEAPVAVGPRASAAAPQGAGGASAPSMVAAASAPPPISAASAAEFEEQSQLIAKERERLRLLEENLTRLRQETEATQKTLATLQTRLRGAESERFSNPLVYALAGLCAVLAFAVGAMWRRYRLREAAWWSSPQDDVPAAAPPTGDLPPVPTLADDVPVPAAAPTSDGRARDAKPAPAATPATAAQPALRHAAVSLDSLSVQPQLESQQQTVPRRELSVEELIDLEQQAEFFVVLGQDDAAIDLLMGHLRSTGGSSPLPYLKLLEIYRRRGDKEAYVRTRERFNRRFNAYAPDWDSDPKDGRALEDYPEMIERLQLLWAKPTQVLEVLDAALFRRDQSEDTYDVPAYRELVLLYSVVRDLAEHDGAAPVVDLLLPIDGAEPAGGGAAPAPAPAPAPSAQPDRRGAVLIDDPMPFVQVTELTAADRKPPALDLDISAVRAFERPIDLEPPPTTLGSMSSFLGLMDDPPANDKKPKS